MNPVADLPLRDIHLPESVSWWPPAIGWWLLPVMIVLILFLAVYLVKKIREPVLKKSARAEIEAVISSYRDHTDRLVLIQQLSIALRRIGMSYLARDSVAGEPGQRWYQHLNQLVEKNKLSDECIQLLSQTAYQKQATISEQQIDSTLSQIRNWVASLSRSKADV